MGRPGVLPNDPGAIIAIRSHLPPANAILGALPPAIFKRLQADIETVELKLGHVLYEPGDGARHVYFPIDSLLSLLVVTDDDALEVGMVGREGMVGLPLAAGYPISPVRVLVQGGGSAMRLPGARFMREVAASEKLRRRVDRSLYVGMVTAMQIAACNKFHLLGERLARWLLMVRDRVGRDEFPLTQDFLAKMLGVRRAGVNEAASELQRRKLIVYRRGRVAIVDRDGVRAAACSCYEVIRKLENAAAR